MTTRSLLNIIGQTAVELAEACKQTGLSWDESISMLGLAAKVLATEAKFNGPDYDFEALGLRRLNEGYKQAINLKFTTKNTGSVN